MKLTPFQKMMSVLLAFSLQLSAGATFQPFGVPEGELAAWYQQLAKGEAPDLATASSEAWGLLGKAIFETIAKDLEAQRFFSAYYQGILNSDRLNPANVTPLLELAARGLGNAQQLESVHSLFKNNKVSAVDPDELATLRVSLLKAAAAHGDLKLLQQLLKEGVDDNQPVMGASALGMAAANGQLGSLDLLLKTADAKNLKNSLYQAVNASQLEAFKRLYQKFPQQNLMPEVLAHAIQEPSGARARERVELVKYLVQQGADLSAKDEEGASLLFAAAGSDNLHMLKYLLEQGLSPRQVDHEGNGPLFIAARNIWSQAPIDSLLAAGAPLNARNAAGESALFEAVHSEQVNNFCHLLVKGADSQLRNRMGESVLEAAVPKVSTRFWLDFKQCPVAGTAFDLRSPASKGTELLQTILSEQQASAYPLVPLLLEWGADPQQRTAKGQTAFELLQQLPDSGLDHLQGTAPAFAKAWEMFMQHHAGILSVKAHMFSLQVMLETYAVDQQGIYPADLQQLELAAKAARPPYLKILNNPFQPNQPGLADYATYQPGPAFAGKVLYQPIVEKNQEKNQIRSYKIYGCNGQGQLLKEQDKIVVFSNS